jgi:hypothetical protein
MRRDATDNLKTAENHPVIFGDQTKIAGCQHMAYQGHCIGVGHHFCAKPQRPAFLFCAFAVFAAGHFDFDAVAEVNKGIFAVPNVKFGRDFCDFRGVVCVHFSSPAAGLSNIVRLRRAFRWVNITMS